MSTPMRVCVKLRSLRSWHRLGLRKVPDHVAEAAPEWPEKYNAVIPLVTPWVYGMKMAEVKASDLSAAWKELCLSQ